MSDDVNSGHESFIFAGSLWKQIGKRRKNVGKITKISFAISE